MLQTTLSSRKRSRNDKEMSLDRPSRSGESTNPRRNQTSNDMPSQCFCFVVTEAPENKIQMVRYRVRGQTFKEGDIIKVITPEGARFSIRLEEREGALWFGKYWELVNGIYGSKNHQLLWIVNEVSCCRSHMLHFRKYAIKAEYPLRHGGVTIAGFFMEIAEQDSLRRLILPAAVKDIFLKHMNNPVVLSDHDLVDKCCTWKIVDGSIVLVKGWNEFAAKFVIKVGDMVFFNYCHADCFVVRVWRKGEPELLFTSAQPSDGGNRLPKLAWGLKRGRQLADEDGRQGGHQLACVGADAGEGTSKRKKNGEETLWTSTLSAKVACGLHPYFIPREPVICASQIKSQRVKIMIPSGEMQEWGVVRDGKSFRLGRGWYQFLKEAALVEGDTLCFYRTDDEDVIKVDIRRKK